jgi:hypothetical protein
MCCCGSASDVLPPISIRSVPLFEMALALRQTGGVYGRVGDHSEEQHAALTQLMRSCKDVGQAAAVARAASAELPSDAAEALYFDIHYDEGESLTKYRSSCFVVDCCVLV